MEFTFADRISDVPRSFIREILKVAADPSIISFAGGLPNRALFPIDELEAATTRVFREAGREALQYSNSEGHLGLREWIAARYSRAQKLDAPVESVLVTTGSQQGLDLLGKVLVNEGDPLVIEEPGYLGAIQAFAVYRPSFRPVRLESDGPDLKAFARVLDGIGSTRRPVVYYAVPNFQNPSGLTYSAEKRTAVADLLRGRNVLILEDDPYGELRFEGQRERSFKHLLPDQTVLLGSFSKIVVPSFRVGWVVAPPALYDRLLVAKQAADLHTNYFAQRVLHRYLTDNDIDIHIQRIVAAYGAQCRAMIAAIGEFFPPEASSTRPTGGMFLWTVLPNPLSSTDLFDRAIKEKVAFVPGQPFYVGRDRTSTLRLNFTCSDPETIREGIGRLGRIMAEMIARARTETV